MCGRVVQKTPLSEIRVCSRRSIRTRTPRRTSMPRRRTCCRWLGWIAKAGAPSTSYGGGLIPYWAKDASIGAHCINAMAETVATKPAFREAFHRGRRCFVPVDGFYEWEKTRGGKQPYLVGMADGSPLALAGLWERWKNPEAAGEVVHTFTVLTTEPNELCAPIHDRMPVILGRENWSA